MDKEEIKGYQKLLQKAGLYDGKIDGIIGPKTSEASKLYEELSDKGYSESQMFRHSTGAPHMEDSEWDDYIKTGNVPKDTISSPSKRAGMDGFSYHDNELIAILLNREYDIHEKHIRDNLINEFSPDGKKLFMEQFEMGSKWSDTDYEEFIVRKKGTVPNFLPKFNEDGKWEGELMDHFKKEDEWKVTDEKYEAGK